MTGTAFGEHLRRARHAQGLTQRELAERAGVSRQLVASVETGRHLPRADAAAAVARTLGTSVEALLVPLPRSPVGVVAPPAEGAPVRLARIGERLVCHPAPPADEGWSPADGVLRDGEVALLDDVPPRAVVVGCDPAIGLAGRLVEAAGGPGVIAALAATATASQALAAGRAHAAVAHGPVGELPAPPVPVHRIEVARWQVGLVAPPQLPPGWAHEALTGRRPVVQRERGATSQAAFERARRAAGSHVDAQPSAVAKPTPPQTAATPGIATGHLDAAARARDQGVVAVSIEPAALATGLAFHALEEHVCELWVAHDHLGVAAVQRFVDELTGARLRRQLTGIGGYDLSRSGREVPA